MGAPVKICSTDMNVDVLLGTMDGGVKTVSVGMGKTGKRGEGEGGIWGEKSSGKQTGDACYRLTPVHKFSNHKRV